MSIVKPALFVVLILFVAGVAFMAGKLSHQPDIGLWDVNMALEAAEALDNAASPEVRKSLEHIATTHLVLAAKLRPPVSKMVGPELEGLCRSMSYFDPQHPSASVREPNFDQSISLLVRPYLQQVAGPLRKRITSGKFSQVMTPRCAELFEVNGPVPCILDSGCPE